MAARTEFKISRETSLNYLFLYYYIANLISDRHVISTLAPRNVLHALVFCSQCFVIKLHPFLVWCLKGISWGVGTDEIAYLLQSRLQFPYEFWRKCNVLEVVLQEFQGTHFDPLKIFHTRAVSFTMRCSQKKKRKKKKTRSFEVEINYSFACRANPVSMNFLRVVVDIILNWKAHFWISLSQTALLDCPLTKSRYNFRKKEIWLSMSWNE